MTHASHRGTGQVLPSQFFMTDEKRCPDPVKIITGLPEDCGVIFRDYTASNRAVRAAQLARLCQSLGLIFLVAGDVRLARSVGADGIHFPEWALSTRPRGGQEKPFWLVTAAVHNITAIDRANQLGVDAMLLAPAFATQSHPERSALGIHRLQRLAACANAPVYALGGLTHAAIKQLAPLPDISGFAGISLFMK